MSWNCEFCEFEGTNETVRIYSLFDSKTYKICDNCFLSETVNICDNYYKEHQPDVLDSIGDDDLEYHIQNISMDYVNDLMEYQKFLNEIAYKKVKLTHKLKSIAETKRKLNLMNMRILEREKKKEENRSKIEKKHKVQLVDDKEV